VKNFEIKLNFELLDKFDILSAMRLSGVAGLEYPGLSGISQIVGETAHE
jgi:hypothetical protein